MSSAISSHSLTAGRAQLVALMQQIGHGRIENLILHGGEPVFRPSPQVIRDFKFASDPSLSTKWSKGSPLKAQVIDMFSTFSEIGDGIVQVLEVKHGLPFRMSVLSSIGESTGDRAC